MVKISKQSPESDGRDELLVDLSAVRQRSLRHRLEIDIARAGCTSVRHLDFWSHFRADPRELPENMIVVADLAELVKSYQATTTHEWAAGIRQSKPIFISWLRTKRDQQCAGLVDDLVKHSEMRLFVCDQMSRSYIKRCLSDAVASSDPRSILEVRCEAEARALWVAFNDGLAGSFRLQDLGATEVADQLRLDTAVVVDGGFSVQLLRKDGEVFDIDSDSIRAFLEPGRAQRLAGLADMTFKHVGEIVRAARTKADLTQVELEERTGIDQALISKLERGQHRPRFDTLKRIATGLGLNVTTLLAGG